MRTLIQTDHAQQSLVLDQHTMLLIQTGMNSLLKTQNTPENVKQDARELSSFLLDPENHDLPALFTRFREIDKCPACLGAGKLKIYPDDRNDEIRFEKCDTCQGEGQLYFIILKKGYAPTEQIRRKMAR